MIEKVIKTIEKYSMCDKNESLLCCLSGGADSTALLLCLHELGYRVKACHINHCLRGEESDRDQRFCEELCERIGIPISVHRLDVKGYCAEKGLSTEEGARELRYGIFEEMGCDRIATAHTLSDCIETAVFNLARGTGLAGLASIPPVRGNIIRPLIECTRADVEAFLRSRGQDWVTDSTNLSDDYTRNRIRHGIVPKLREINPSLEQTMLGTLENLRRDNELVRKLADEFYEKAVSNDSLDCRLLLSGEPSLTGRAVRKFAGMHGAECPRETVRRIIKLCETGGKLTLGHGKYAVSDGERLRIVNARQEIPYTEIKAEPDMEIPFLGRTVKLEVISKKDFAEIANIHQNLTNQAADYGKIKGVIVVRNRRAGDRIRLKGRNFTSDVKKLLQSAFPSGERRRAVVLSDDEGVIFVEGFGFAERCAAGRDSNNLLFCKIS